MSASPAGQATQAEPALPQVAVVGGVQTPDAQQPVAQLPALHAPPLQVPALQVWPAAHAGPEPQRQAPVAEQLSASVAEQLTQLDPPAPQDESVRALHVLLWQHPLGHDVASHTHRPTTQRWPPGHAAAPPQLHTPAAEQLSVRFESHAAHAIPEAAQVERVSAEQVVPAQHPLGQEMASHAHAPPMQRWPAPHSVAPPHWQTPPAEQPSARDAPVQSTHDPPPVPQLAAAGALHRLFAQHPAGHEVPSHTHPPPAHRCPASQRALAPHLHAPCTQ